MGKSPGKWIKTLLFGKKTTRSHSSRTKDNLARNDKGYFGGKDPPALAVNSPVISEPVLVSAGKSGIIPGIEKGAPSNLPNDGAGVTHQHEDKSGILGPTTSNDQGKLREEQAAVKAQAAARGFLARRAFRTLKGIIRLQALVRGHLVRRQAVATLYAIHAIVKVQALVRGWQTRHSCISGEVASKFFQAKAGGIKVVGDWRENLSANVFVNKLLCSSPSAMPLQIHYANGEPNSSFIWLERWTSYHVWKPVSPPKKTLDSKPQTKRHTYAIETESGKPKRIPRKNSTTNGTESGPTTATSDPEKPKRNLRKVSSPAVDSKQEHPQSTITEKPSRSSRRVSSASTEVLEHGMKDSTEKPKKDISPSVEEKPEKDSSPSREKKPDAEATQKGMTPAEPTDDCLAIQVPRINDTEKGEDSTIMNGVITATNSKEEQASNENQKHSKRRSSFSAKSEYADNGSPKTPTLPSYMAATESAKAKLRAQNSPRFGSDPIDRNGSTRRHSLPSSTNGKLSSHSPRAQRLIQASGKGSIRSDRSLLSSRDANERPIQVEWRR
ncbi:P-loop containing nucleoside triphosphate hydrolase protein [Dioscorea alata]|uniref:P-loop containing nucleoside triphosphate hydrolase protein n=2 Tax=Dioscorea alata TaxID=55571 RepID=A0ACB7TW31_DIOAL|nr:P-loop containing nucleoside triphosphate hydrolase protein [Dioscorea alata]KAH7651986.1 P-loop containing nucleoside triphosphate hydrolase protein [Dioscorea alata]